MNPSTSLCSSTTTKHMTKEEEDGFLYSQMKELLTFGIVQLPVCPFCKNGICEDGLAESKMLIRAFSNSTRFMQVSFSNADRFIKETKKEVELTEMKAEDVIKLSKVELTGVLFWVEKIGHISLTSEEDMRRIIKRYAARKLILDHFYSASKHPEMARDRRLVLNNYTYVPNGNTRYTIDNGGEQIANVQFVVNLSADFWTNVVDTFIQMGLGDAEMVFLHHLLIWSPLIRRLVSVETQRLARARRSWAAQMMLSYYNHKEIAEPEIRIAQLIQLYQEIETRVEQVSESLGENDLCL